MIKETREDLIKFIEHKCKIHDFEPNMTPNEVIDTINYHNCVDYWMLVPCAFKGVEDDFLEYVRVKAKHLKLDRCQDRVMIKHLHQSNCVEDGYCENCFKIRLLVSIGLFHELYERDVRNNRLHLFIQSS